MKLRRMRKARSLNCTKLYRLYRDGSRGRVQGVRNPSPPPEMTCGFLIQLLFCKKKKTMWFIGVEVERETSAPPPKKNLGSALVIVLPTRRLNSFAGSSLFQAFSAVQCDAN